MNVAKPTAAFLYYFAPRYSPTYQCLNLRHEILMIFQIHTMDFFSFANIGFIPSFSLAKIDLSPSIENSIVLIRLRYLCKSSNKLVSMFIFPHFFRFFGEVFSYFVNYV